MANIEVDFSKIFGKIKPMHCVNNGPYIDRSQGQTRTNEETFRDAGIPYARVHDAAFDSHYGGEHTVDVDLIFRDWNADPNDASAYDFIETDQYMQDILKVDCKPFYRLGSKIEWTKKKYHNIPKDFDKWAKVCERIIAHYNDGWADGFNYGIEYWEIWNEPDGWEEREPKNRPTWGGSREQFFELYCNTAKLLKEKHPECKIGGPAHGFVVDWLEQFLDKVKSENAPLDFFSWHIYRYKLSSFLEWGREVRGILDKHGFKDTPSICNEWNYVEGWTGDAFTNSILKVIGLRGAGYAMSSMLMFQDEPVDMLMYYDARLCVWNGLFDYYTLKPLKGYYAFYNFNKLYRLGTQVNATKDKEDVYVVGATNGEKNGLIISYFPDLGVESTEQVTVSLKGVNAKAKKVYITNEEKTNQEIKVSGENEFTVELEPNAFVYIEL